MNAPSRELSPPELSSAGHLAMRDGSSIALLSWQLQARRAQGVRSEYGGHRLLPRVCPSCPSFVIPIDRFGASSSTAAAHPACFGHVGQLRRTTSQFGDLVGAVCVDAVAAGAAVDDVALLVLCADRVVPGSSDRRSSPRPPISVSFPAPPSRRSLPLPPLRVSLPPRPLRMSANAVPVRWSAPAEPLIVLPFGVGTGVGGTGGGAGGAPTWMVTEALLSAGSESRSAVAEAATTCAPATVPRTSRMTRVVSPLGM